MTDIITADITTAADTVMVHARLYAAQAPTAGEGMDAINPGLCLRWYYVQKTRCIATLTGYDTAGLIFIYALHNSHQTVCRWLS